MKIDVTQQIRDLDGAPMVTSKQVCQMCGQAVGKMEPLTVRLAATRALTAPFMDERDLAGDKKIERFHLALRIHDEDEPDLKAEDVVLIKSLVGKMYGPLVVGRMWTILDPSGE